jgi:hypothetical protein
MVRTAIGLLVVAVFMSNHCCIANAQKDSDNRAVRLAAARQLIAAAMKESQRISAADRKSLAYSNIAEAQLSVGDTADARATAAKITGWKNGLYQQIVVAEAAVGNIAGANEIVENMERESLKGEARRVIVKAQLKAGDIAGAKATAGRIAGVSFGKAGVYRSIAHAQIKAGDNVGAIESLAVAAKAADQEWLLKINRGELLEICLDVFAAQRKLGDSSAAQRTLLIARRFAEEQLDGRSVPWACHVVFEAQAMAGDIIAAKAAAARYTGQLGGVSLQPVAYGGIASAQAKTGDIAGAKATAAAIREVREDAGCLYWKESAFADIAAAQAAQGDIEGAKITAEQAGKYWKASAYRAIAEVQVKAGDVTGAKTTAAETDDEFGAYDKMLAYFAIANALAKAGDMAGARQAFDLAEATVSRDKDEDWKESRCYDIVNAREEVGDLAGAKMTAARIGYWSKVAELQAKGSDLAAARETLKKAAKAAAELDDSRRDGVYLSIAKDQAKFGDLVGAKETAVRISDEHAKGRVHSQIIAAQTLAGDMAGAIDYSASLTDDSSARCGLLCDAAKDLCDAP